MRLELGTSVSCSDGAFGELADLVIDPARRRVTHLVVQPQHRGTLAGSRLIPIELVDPAGPGAEINLLCSLDEASGLEPLEEFAHLRLGEFPIDDPDWDVGVATVLAMPYYMPAELGTPDYAQDAEIVYDRIPKHEVEIGRASLVTSADGHSLGQVEAFILDAEGQVTHFVLEHGHLWGRRDVTIPIGAVTEIETDSVTVGLTKDEVGALDAVRVHRW